ncbi:ABC transporter ATP-binding protein [Chengkuizengella axinellae]|uniref:ABC transporter ATP-binding protein n=1 Tax=Chengkuizengella axinellae TaxID=3064388 RepID=A0ABT9J0C3_9BACL|nr:ABC transporter ATP-binding protein [Chengkuizengella sp. 2205SS18-9]MDP5275028.1 ABC transporter ATP-binding protein [Chengkuizengella sp. 2205SS18-9]
MIPEQQMEQHQQGLIMEAKGVKRTFGKGNNAVHALKNVNLHIPKGCLVALKGRSGSGKTTLLNVLGTLDKPTEGTVYFQNKNITDLSDKERTNLRRKDIGLIFQSFALTPYMTALENVEFGLRIADIPSKERTKLAEEALNLVGMKKRMKHRPYELSGGEQQRVAIARCVAHQPALILADEPTAELDSKMAFQVIHLFKKLIQDTGMTVVLTTHDPDVMELVDYLYELEDGEIVQTKQIANI